MKLLRLLLAIAALSALTATVSTASADTPRVDRREARQQARIRQGVRHDQLTMGEAARLRHGQRHVQRMERRAKADGVVTLQERRALAHAQNRQSRRIARLRHNSRGC